MDKITVFAMNRPRAGLDIWKLFAASARARSQQDGKGAPYRQFDILSAMSMSYDGAGENDNVPLQPDDTKLPELKQDKLRRLTCKRPWPASVVPVGKEEPRPAISARSGSQPTGDKQAPSNSEEQTADDTANSIGRRLVHFFRSDANMKCAGVRMAHEMLPQECQDYIGELRDRDRRELMD